MKNENPQPPPRSRLRILMLEDLPADAELSEHELKHAGLEFESRRVDTMEAFVRELAGFAPDAVLSDYNLPGFTGMDAFRSFRAGGPDIPFILVTGALQEEQAVECIKEGMDDYILKGKLSRLPSALEKALEKKEVEREKKAAMEELRQNLDEVERLNKLMVGREIRMGELREENERLKERLKELERKTG